MSKKISYTFFELLENIQKCASLFPEPYKKPYVKWLTSDNSLGISKNGYYYVPKGDGYVRFKEIGDWIYKYRTWNWNERYIERKVHDTLLLGKDPEKIHYSDIISCRNIEIRRTLMERYGWDRFLKFSNSMILDQDGEMQLVLIMIDDDDEPMMFVRVKDSSTLRFYFIQVPPHMTFCREAVAWTFGLGPEEYCPIVET
jgi:uncharacterized protein DUF6745